MTITCEARFAKASRPVSGAALTLALESPTDAGTGSTTLVPGSSPHEGVSSPDPSSTTAHRLPRAWKAPHLGPSHPLAEVAARHCFEHTGQRGNGVGKVACGACWERAIRDDERVVVEHDLPRDLVPDPTYVDEIAVDLACRGEQVSPHAGGTRRCGATPGRAGADPSGDRRSAAHPGSRWSAPSSTRSLLRCRCAGCRLTPTRRDPGVVLRTPLSRGLERTQEVRTMTIVTPHPPPVDIGTFSDSTPVLGRIAERRLTDPAVSSAVTVGPFVGVNLHQPTGGRASVVLAVAGGARACVRRRRSGSGGRC